MTIGELHGIINKHCVNEGAYPEHISGCELLEHIVDVPGFVSLLRKFTCDRNFGKLISFVEDYPDVIGAILGGDVEFFNYYGFIRIDYNFVSYFHRDSQCFYWG